jgi:predicted Zn-dependent peptidase
MSNRMSRLAKSEIYFQRMIMIEEIVSAITKVSKDDVAAVASDLLHRSRFALAAIGPFEEHPECLNGVVAAE